MALVLLLDHSFCCLIGGRLQHTDNFGRRTQILHLFTGTEIPVDNMVVDHLD
jgi:hypothetical protein